MVGSLVHFYTGAYQNGFYTVQDAMKVARRMKSPRLEGYALNALGKIEGTESPVGVISHHQIHFGRIARGLESGTEIGVGRGLCHDPC